MGGDGWRLGRGRGRVTDCYLADEEPAAAPTQELAVDLDTMPPQDGATAAIRSGVENGQKCSADIYTRPLGVTSGQS